MDMLDNLFDIDALLDDIDISPEALLQGIDLDISLDDINLLPI